MVYSVVEFSDPSLRITFTDQELTQFFNIGSYEIVVENVRDKEGTVKNVRVQLTAEDPP